VVVPRRKEKSFHVVKEMKEGLSRGISTKLLLFGDRMQQIYKNYDGSFEDTLQKEFNTTEFQLKNNYRSVKNIVDVLNKIYLMRICLYGTVE